MPWRIELFEDEEGCPVRDFLDGLPPAHRAKVLALIRLLEEEGPTWPFPYSSQIEGKLRELRTQHGNERYRVLYFGAPSRGFVLLHGIQKHTKETPRRDIEIASARMSRYLHRVSGKPKGRP
jgi:phage-related protein